MAAYTEKQKVEALKLYVEHGPAEAARRTGIARATISKWAQRKGVTVTRNSKTRAATEAAKAAAAEKRATMREKMIDKWHGIMDRIDEPHQEFVGQQGKEVSYKVAPSGAVRHYVQSAVSLLEKIRLEEGQATDRTEHTTQSEFDREVRELTEKVRHVEPEHSSNGVG
jgi:hypothetical protein